MEIIFNVVKEENLTSHKVILHGRSLAHINLDQIIYLDSNGERRARILKIISYSRELPEIDIMMGCAVEIEILNGNGGSIKQLFR